MVLMKSFKSGCQPFPVSPDCSLSRGVVGRVLEGEKKEYEHLVEIAASGDRPDWFPRRHWSRTSGFVSTASSSRS